MADDETRTNGAWDLMQSGRLEAAQFVATLIEDALTRELVRIRIQRAVSAEVEHGA